MIPRRSILAQFLLLGASILHGATANAATRRKRRRRSSRVATRSLGAKSTEAMNKAEFVQPNYAKWRQVKVGMQQSEVLALLGEPRYGKTKIPNFLLLFPIRRARRPRLLVTAGVPHHPIAFVGKQKGRWRVRAQNNLGRSDWSDYRYFTLCVVTRMPRVWQRSQD